MAEKIDHSASSFARIIELIETLRGKNGCPWDRQQTPQTIVLYLIEEAFELMDAIQNGQPDDICEELGDVLFLILFIASQFQEAGHFNIDDVTRLNKEKMTRRHPHVFGIEKAATTDEVRHRWQMIKSKEKGNRADTSILASIPNTLPALMRAHRISERAARTGFDWQDVSGVMRKAEEEWDEFKKEMTGEEQDPQSNARALEFGDVLFTLVNVARLAGIHPESALLSATKKFENRFKHMEEQVRTNQTEFETLSFDEMHVLWDKAKKKIK